jgi:hypothetical protein
MFSRQIREYKLANPNATAKEIAEVIGVRVNYVYQALKFKPTRIPKVQPVAVKPTAGQDLLRTEIQRLHKEIEKWKNAADFQEAKANECLKHNRELKLHHNGLEYVISYLESRLGIKEQDGTTV